MQPRNWRGTRCSLGTGRARDIVWELEGHVIQSGNWKGARDPARELEGHVMQPGNWRGT